MSDGSQWPRISIVTPSLNQGRFIEETIRSVLLQGYPDLEYIIIDGGSTDGSIEVIRKYEKWLTYWVTEPDTGQSQAINKGIVRSTGQIFAWVNSDDLYCINAFMKVAQAMWHNGLVSKPIVYGHLYWINESGEIISKSYATPVTRDDIIAFWIPGKSINQPTLFLTLSLLKNNLLNESLHYAMDWDLWLRLSATHNFFLLPTFLSYFRYYHSSKSGTGKEKFFKEQIKISREYWHESTFSYFQLYLSYEKYRIKQVFLKVWNHLKALLYLFLGNKNYNAIKTFKKIIFNKKQ
jgi:glycosyltransferase involved in cell wall biosynthesis